MSPASIPPGLAARQCCSTVARTPHHLSPPPAPRSVSLPKCFPRVRVRPAQVRSLRPALTLCLSFLPARGRRGLGTEWVPAPREESFGGMVPETGSVEPLGFPTTLGTPASEQVVHPSQSSGRQQLGRGKRAAQLLPHQGAESPLPLCNGARSSVDLLNPHPSLGAPSTRVRLRASSQGPQLAPLASPSPAAQYLQSPLSPSPPRPLRGTGVTARLPCATNVFPAHPNSERPPRWAGRLGPQPLCSSPALAFLCAVAGRRGWARQAELAPLAGSPPRHRPVRAR